MTFCSKESGGDPASAIDVRIDELNPTTPQCMLQAARELLLEIWEIRRSPTRCGPILFWFAQGGSRPPSGQLSGTGRRQPAGCGARRAGGIRRLARAGTTIERRARFLGAEALVGAPFFPRLKVGTNADAGGSRSRNRSRAEGGLSRHRTGIHGLRVPALSGQGLSSLRSVQQKCC